MYCSEEYKDIEEKILKGERLSREDGLRLFACNDIAWLGNMADMVRKRKCGDYVYYNVNCHVNLTNICTSRCKFCAFGRDAEDKGAYAMSVQQALDVVADAMHDPHLAGLHVVSGLHPDWSFDDYLERLQALHDTYPSLYLKGFTGVEITHFADISGLSIRQVLEKLQQAGLQAIAGGGAEILTDRVRNELCPNKASADQWLEVARVAHSMGIKTNASMLYGHIETMEERVEQLILNHAEMPVKSGSELGRCRNSAQEMHADYIDHLLATIGCDLSGLRVLVDCANGAAAATAPDLFQRLPVMADFINIDPDGVNINNGCGSTHLEQLATMTVAGKYQLGIAFDGDADRCLLVDEKGHTIDGDKIMAVCGVELRRSGKLTNNTVVATVMSNLGLHEFCRREGIDLVCTAVGDRHVLEKMVACDYAIGGEQSGHMIFREYATTGDGELTALQFLKALKAFGKPASELAGCCAQYPQELINVTLSHVPGEKERIMASPVLQQAVQEQEKALGEEGRILLRPSGTEALIRVMVEAKTDEIARKIAEDLSEVVKSI